MCHDGPDGYEIYIEEKIGLGHRRLAIIDLSDAGKQPMQFEDSVIFLTVNFTTSAKYGRNLSK